MKNKMMLGMFALLFLLACQGDDEKIAAEPETAQIVVPPFNADSAYHFIQAQVDFGPRIPNTPEHDACAVYLADKLRAYGAEVTIQEANATAYNGDILQMKNIIGAFQPEKTRRILLYAHYDTRPWADKDEDQKRRKIPFDGANDGGSGVGVLLEIARNIGQNYPEHGIDIIFFDAEDYGTPTFANDEGAFSDWCLGSQYWSKNPHVPNYRARFGILLDMVGGKDAVFNKEGTSMHYAPHIVSKIWKKAQSLGYGQYFKNEITQQTTDDHLFVNEFAHIPSANIVHFHLEPEILGYGFFHHTHLDNMAVIDTATLAAVGNTVMAVIYDK